MLFRLALIIMAVAFILGLVWQQALAIGLILALSSTAIVLQTLKEKGLIRTDGGQNSFSVLLFQDIAVIPMLAILPLLAIHETAAATGTEHVTYIQTLPVWLQTLAVLVAVAIIVIAGRYLTIPIFRFIARTRLREIFTAAALLLIIGIALLMSQVGLSPALGTFLAGVVLAGSEYRHELESDIEPFKGLLLGLFFIAVGAGIDFALIAENPWLILQLVGLLLVIKFFVLLVLGRMFGLHADSNLLFSFALAQGGEFGFVLFSFAIQNGVLSAGQVAPLIAVIAISMALTPLLMLLNEKIILPRVGTREKDEREADVIDEENPVIMAGFGHFGNIMGRLLQANGVGTTVLDIDADNVDMLRKLGFKVFYGDASRHDLLQAAGAEQAKIIILAISDSDKTFEIVETVRKHFPHLIIFARAAGRAEAYELLEMGVKHVYRQTLDTSLRAGIDVLKQLGFRSFHAHRSARMFRQRDEADLRDLAGMRHDRKTYISTARQKIADLEHTLLSELQSPVESRDEGWDTTGLRREFGQKTKNKPS